MFHMLCIFPQKWKIFCELTSISFTFLLHVNLMAMLNSVCHQIFDAKAVVIRTFIIFFCFLFLHHTDTILIYFRYIQNKLCTNWTVNTSWDCVSQVAGCRIFLCSVFISYFFSSKKFKNCPNGWTLFVVVAIRNSIFLCSNNSNNKNATMNLFIWSIALKKRGMNYKKYV